jgi:hypothetical protein
VPISVVLAEPYRPPLIRCRRGVECPWYRENKCTFDHSDDPPAKPILPGEQRPCYHGLRCKFLKQGTCRYNHDWDKGDNGGSGFKISYAAKKAMASASSTLVSSPTISVTSSCTTSTISAFECQEIDEGEEGDEADERTRECLICFGSMTEAYAMACGHVLCKGCANKCFNAGECFLRCKANVCRQPPLKLFI